MSKTRVLVRHGDGETLNVLGTGLRFLCGADKTDRSWSLMEVEVPERAGAPPHHHPWDEAYYILEGNIRFLVDGEEQTLARGDFVYLPAGTLHGFEGASTPPARTLIFDAPAHAEAFFRELDRDVKDLSRDLSKVPDIAAQHQIHMADHAAR
ncbi:MAG TPA: cupin domain-containing protein [Methylomirabilota bacterium]|nr:cupin domain-containing protein [Methylomirabilota bacterium]